ncbi:hypothetical protein SAMN04488107_2978 [Geodermatophilus saharensis]|uniref:Uncharacterized protein n=1 Tax=Geodermatophilus saharensis TaxID=1137994 RepID=A0A239FE79_9ACTN|nr:hypothetical protein [Geodermatophilus saharensis]SNS55127.1 hypothetical protein SAMN04488107_2978 [Geodermatophilus saharensis]
MSDDLTIDIDGDQYVLRQGTEGLQVGRRVGGEVAWLDDVDPALLSEDARAALAEGDTTNPALQTAIGGIVQAEVERGG